MLAAVLALVAPAVSAFHRVAARDADFAPHDDARRRQLALLDDEAAVLPRERRRRVVQEARQCLRAELERNNFKN